MVYMDITKLSKIIEVWFICNPDVSKGDFREVAMNLLILVNTNPWDKGCKSTNNISYLNLKCKMKVMNEETMIKILQEGESHE